MKPTARQRAFLKLAAMPEGFSPIDPPKGAPILKNEEIQPLIDAHLIVFAEADDTWNTTGKGDALLAQDKAGAA